MGLRVGLELGVGGLGWSISRAFEPKGKGGYRGAVPTLVVVTVCSQGLSPG